MYTTLIVIIRTEPIIILIYKLEGYIKAIPIPFIFSIYIPQTIKIDYSKALITLKRYDLITTFIYQKRLVHYNNPQRHQSFLLFCSVLQSLLYQSFLICPFNSIVQPSLRVIIGQISSIAEPNLSVLVCSFSFIFQPSSSLLVGSSVWSLFCNSDCFGVIGLVFEIET